MPNPPRIVLLRGIVGSRAQGLSREGSDTDQLGIFTYSTDAFWHLGALDESVRQEEPFDMQEHEVRKFLRLALRSNPALLELLWLPRSNYTILTALGDSIIKTRKAFLSTDYVRTTYHGYAMQQIKRLQRRHEEGKEGFSSDTKKRTPKHARHCFRLLEQGRELLATGELTVKVADPVRYWAFDNMPIREIVARFEQADAEFAATDSVLPDSPDYARVDMLLYMIRRTLLV